MKGASAYRGNMLAFEFLVLTAARSGEVCNARWEQIGRDGNGRHRHGTRPDVASRRVARAPSRIDRASGAASRGPGAGVG